MTSRFARFLLEKMGWTRIGGVIPEDKCIFLEAPHTSFMDFFIGYLFYRSVGGHLRIMIKKELFFFPLGPVLRAMGGVPIDRKNPQKMVMDIIGEMQKSKGVFHLAICPEGTRSAVRKWKTGYHFIARATGAPVYLGYVDWGRKRVSGGERFDISDNARADTDRIQAIYREMGVVGKHPEKFIA